MEASSSGARARGVGAVARGEDPHRRRGLWWLLAGLVLLAVIAAILIAALGGGSHHARHVSARGAAPAAAAPATSTAAAAAAPSAAGSQSTAASVAKTGAAALPNGQVGGGGVTARTATGRLAPAGSVGAVLFAEASIALDANARHVVNTAVKEIRAHHIKSVTVVGYTDTIGNVKANRTLSLERARAVAAAIRAQLKGSTTHFSAIARGETHPVAPDSTPQGRQLDRRVAIFVT